MSSVRDIITLTIFAGLGLAILTNASDAARIIGAVSEAWNSLIESVSGRS